MKKVKTTIALLLSCITLCAPLAACKATPNASLPNVSQDSNVSPSPDTSFHENVDESADASADESTEDGAEDSAQQPSSSTPPTSSSSSSLEQTSSSVNSTTPPTDETPTTAKATYIRCTGDSVNLREGAGTNFSVIGSAQKGTMYAIIGKTGDWYKLYYRNKTVYISAAYVSVVTMDKTDNDEVEQVLLEGYKLLGVPYVYGAVRYHDGKGNLLKGFNAQKFDCSSLVQYAFYKGAKKLLNTTTRTQVKQGKYVSKSNLRRGDCIYFTNEDRQYNTGVERVGHVAIYLGNDYILHTSSDYARIEKMTATRWSFYIEARRFV